MNKQCKYCKQIKDVTEYNFHCVKTGRMKNKCKACEKEYNKINYQKQKEKYIENANKWKTENRDKFLDNQKKYNEKREKS